MPVCLEASVFRASKPVAGGSYTRTSGRKCRDNGPAVDPYGRHYRLVGVQLFGYLLSSIPARHLISHGILPRTRFMKVLGKIINNLPGLSTATEFLLFLKIKGGHHMDKLIIGVQAH